MTLSIVVTAPSARLTAPAGEPWAVLAEWPLPTRGTLWVVATAGPWGGFQKAVHAALPQMRDQLEEGIGHTIQPGERQEGRAVLWTDLDGAGVPNMIEVGIEYGKH